MRKALSLLILLALLTAPLCAADKVPDYAQGVREILSYQPKLSSPHDTAATLKDILKRPEFHGEQKPPPGPSLLDRFLNWIGRHLTGLTAGAAGAGITTTVIAAVVIAALLALLVYVVVRAMWARMSRQDEEARSIDEATLSSTGLRELAARSASAGDFRAALRYRFRSVVGELNLPDTDRLTNWQLLRHVRREHNSATADFAALVALFEDCWYGGQHCGPEQYSQADHLAGRVELQLVPMEQAA